MNLSLTKVKIAKHLSQETTAFSAVLTLAGDPIATVMNDGQGGCNCITPLDQKRVVVERAYAWAKAQPPVQFEGVDLKMNLDLWISLELEKIDIKKTIDRINKKSVAFRFLKDHPNEVRIYKGRGWTREALLADLKSKHPEAILL